MPSVQPTAIPDVKYFLPDRFGDDRGYFSEVFNQARFDEYLDSDITFVQDNESLSSATGTIRGLHFQKGEHSQAKLVRAISGSLLDVAVDLRKSSSTFGQHVAVELDQASGGQLWIPTGFAHGFCTLEPNTVIGYKATGYYNAESDASLAWDDPELSIEWPEVADATSLSAKDASAMKFSELEAAGALYE